MKELIVEVSGARHTGDLEKARADLRAAGASIMSDSANYTAETLHFRVEVNDEGVFRKAFETTATSTRSKLRGAR